MYIRLCCYLYAIFLICVSSSSFALTALEQANGGFASSSKCSHPSDLDYCVSTKNSDAAEQACMLWRNNLNQEYSYSFTGITNNTCRYEGKNPTNGQKAYQSQSLTTRAGLCPVAGSPPPNIVVFSRKGRWFPQELDNKRCYKNCEYSNGQSFTYKHYQFTNGIVTEFTEKSDRLKSTENLCQMLVEPERDSNNEITYESNCDDAVFKQICDFINWFRHDEEMPKAPEVENKDLDLPTSLNKAVVQINPEETADFLCFPDYDFKLYLPLWNKQITHTFEFNSMCEGIRFISNFIVVIAFMHAAFIVFRK